MTTMWCIARELCITISYIFYTWFDENDYAILSYAQQPPAAMHLLYPKTHSSSMTHTAVVYVYRFIRCTGDDAILMKEVQTDAILISK
jgi:hypothetical protein